ncbi:hypothetical protein RD055328_06720 [Companilactobacillus sp. RD055328]|uniref:hypothetical protein n=1 Tax=Companilactobacillus sp. RD055328 TaxID=2916634 RepID=UPI001FC8B226|nr:hypothetical protein [Companilactobacillus sp. RD055328]GKQ42749.1 hypothetical protein RD055328_06720 [Companilactobacillus sp. RD055328]
MNIWYGKVVSGARNVPFRNYGAAGKARQDAHKFLEQIGARPIPMFAYDWDDEPDESLNGRMDGMLSEIKKGDIIIQLYPNGTNSPKYLEFFFKRARLYGAKVVGYIHDINLYRGDYNDWKNKEVNPAFSYYLAYIQLREFDALICPTENMAVQLRHDIGYEGPISISGPHGFDTLMVTDRTEKSDTVIFAGSFEKNRSLNELMDNSPRINFNIYGGSSGENSGENGVKFYLKEHPNANIMGKFDPDALIMSLEGAYGLVWDSLDYPEVIGGKGLYEILNTPHKFSMYIAAEIPLIVWSKIALADYVLENNIGWVIDDLTQLEDLVLNITEEDYQQKLDNLEVIGGMIRSGIQLKKSVFEIVSLLNEKPLYEVATNEVNPAPDLGIDKFIIDLYNNDLEGLKNIYLSDEFLNYFRNNLYPDEPNYVRAKEILLEINKI